MRVFKTLDEYADAQGEELGTSDWMVIDQATIDKFAETTGDDQWIHTDPEKCMQRLNHGTIAHGYYTLSLVPVLGKQVYSIESATRGINYGSNKLRFNTPIPVGSKIRLRSFLQDARRRAGGLMVTRLEKIEIEGQSKPALTVETLSLYYED